MPPSILHPKILAYIGIDPGQKGGIVCITFGENKDTRVVSQWDMPPTREGVINLMRSLTNTYRCRAVIESVHAMPGNSGQSMFSFGQGFGVLLTCLDVFGWDYTLEDPRRWQTAVGIRPKGKGEEKNEWKKRLVRYANTALHGTFTTYTGDAALLAMRSVAIYKDLGIG